MRAIDARLGEVWIHTCGFGRPDAALAMREWRWRRARIVSVAFGMYPDISAR